MKNILLKIEYDGTDYHGWQLQPNLKTVQGEIERVLSLLCAQNIRIDGTSRTDAGVHAYGQRASFSGDFGIPVEKIKFTANNLLDKSVRIVEVEEVPLDFHARFSCTGKTYIYRIANRKYIDPFTRKYCYTVREELNIENMRKAAKYILGKHDFKCFQSTGGKVRESTVRTISQLDIIQDGDMIEIKITGDGFLYNMVRIITGTLVDVGKGKKSYDSLEKIIESKDRYFAGHTAPPNGLFLYDIYYE